MELTAEAEWTGRNNYSAVVLADGSILLMGGYDGENRLNDVWQSTDMGATWTELTAEAEWSARNAHASVSLPDDSILIMGGTNGSRFNDVWKLQGSFEVYLPLLSR